MLLCLGASRPRPILISWSVDLGKRHKAKKRDSAKKDSRGGTGRHGEAAGGSRGQQGKQFAVTPKRTSGEQTRFSESVGQCARKGRIAPTGKKTALAAMRKIVSPGKRLGNYCYLSPCGLVPYNCHNRDIFLRD